MDREKRAKEKKEPEEMSRDAFLKGLVEIINEDFNLPLKFVKSKCDRDKQNELPMNITN